MIFDDVRIPLKEEKTGNNYNSNKFAKVVTEGFYSILSARDKYRKLYDAGVTKMNLKVIHEFRNYCLLIIHPICPYWTTHLWTNAESNKVSFSQTWTDYVNNPPKIDYGLVFYANCIDNVVNNCNVAISKKKSIKSVTVTIFNKFNDTELKILDIYKTYNSNQAWTEFIVNAVKDIDKKSSGNYIKFLKYIKGQCEKYSSKWMDFVTNADEEHKVYNEWLPILTGMQITIELGKEKPDFRNGPGDPVIICQ